MVLNYEWVDFHSYIWKTLTEDIDFIIYNNDEKAKNMCACDVSGALCKLLTK